MVALSAGSSLAGDNGTTSYCGVEKSVQRDEAALTVSVTFKTVVIKKNTPQENSIENLKNATAVLKEKSYENLLRQEVALSGFLATSKSMKKTPYVCVAKVVADDGEEIPYVSFSWTSSEDAESDLAKQL